MKKETRATSQKALILAHLQNDSITPKEAYFDFSCMRLASVICDLRKDGHNIITKEDSNKYATYELIKKEVA